MKAVLMLNATGKYRRPQNEIVLTVEQNKEDMVEAVNYLLEALSYRNAAIAFHTRVDPSKTYITLDNG